MSINEAIFAATVDRGTSIDSRHMAIMEECFQASFRDVRLHFSTASDSANDALNSLAFAVGNHICFRSGFDPTVGTSFTYLLAHELTHVMQKRRGRELAGNLPCTGSEEHLEQEARAIAAGVLKGKRASHITPDASPVPRLFGPAGHYWTAFYTALAVGFDFQTANDIAFYTQLPDLVAELDAIPAGGNWWEEYGKGYLSTAEIYLSVFDSDREFWRRTQDRTVDAMLLAWQVQAGLHSLTGGNAEEETKKRTRILNQCEPGTLEFGLAVHAFGDSFAHRDFHTGTRMYGPPFGHASDIINHLIRVEWPNPHDPDKIVKRPGLYVAYGISLYEVLSGKTRNKAPVDKDLFASQLKEVASLEDDVHQGHKLREKMLTLSKFDNVYDPPDKSFPWSDFLKQPENKRLDPAILSKALGYAAVWCASASVFQITVTLPHPIDSLENDLATVTGANLTPMQFYSRLPY